MSALKKISFDFRNKKQSSKNEEELPNGSVSPNELHPDSGCDSSSEKSSTSERRIMRRSSLICSSGKDKFTYDSEHADVPLRSIERELNTYCPTSTPSNLPLPSEPVELNNTDLSEPCGSTSSGRVKRDSVVNSRCIDVQRSLFVNGRFQNPWPTWRPPSFTNILKFGFSRDKSNVPIKNDLDLVLPLVRPNFNEISKPPTVGIRITWLGHSTVLVQFDGVTILTDPIFSDRASPSQMVGPKRYREPACTIEELPLVHCILISHNHYDHLDLNSVVQLNNRFGADVRWFVPSGLASWMNQVGCENVAEMDWWEESLIPNITTDVAVVFTPAQHWCKRTINDDNRVLWGSWCVMGPRYRFFFAGDTGYCEAFKQIGAMFGPFDICAIPIGAYEPRWFMKYQHVNPEEAVKIHLDVASKNSLAVHWGTFALANEYYLDPPLKLQESMESHGIPPREFFTMKHGETKWIQNL